MVGTIFHHQISNSQYYEYAVGLHSSLQMLSEATVFCVKCRPTVRFRGNLTNAKILPAMGSALLSHIGTFGLPDTGFMYFNMLDHINF